jgi:two-component system cell cycle response regulator
VRDSEHDVDDDVVGGDDDERTPTAEIDDSTLARHVRQMEQRRSTLVVLSGATVGRAIPLGADELVFGRDSSNPVCIPDEGVSRHHAALRPLPDGLWEVRDLGSTNGTLVNGDRTVRRVLHDGDRLLLGHTVLKFFAQAEVDEEYQRQTYELSVRDGLTQLYNRRFFDDRLHAEVAYARRHRTRLTLLMIDIDRFKRVNDDHGHTAGDQVLREVAASMQGRIRTEDVLARWGGEEFALLAREIPAAGALALAERLRLGVAGLTIVHGWTRIRVTLSIGVATTEGSPELADAALVDAADRLLYEAKAGGRNRTRALPTPEHPLNLPRAARITEV